MSLVMVRYAEGVPWRLVFKITMGWNEYLNRTRVHLYKRLGIKGAAIRVPEIGREAELSWEEDNLYLENGYVTATIPMSPDYDLRDVQQMNQLAKWIQDAVTRKVDELYGLMENLAVINEEASA